MHSFLVVGSVEAERNQKARDLAADSQGPDLLLVSNEDRNSIGIEKVRQVISWLTTKPFQSRIKTVIIENAHLMTVEAQNALLKNLEEPPGNAQIVLAAHHKSWLLPTIVSRCATLELPTRAQSGAPKPASKGADEFIKILSQDLGKRLDFVEENKEMFLKKETALRTIDDWLLGLEPRLEQKGLAQAARLLLEVKKEVAITNMSPRNLIELFLIKL